METFGLGAAYCHSTSSLHHHTTLIFTTSTTLTHYPHPPPSHSPPTPTLTTHTHHPHTHHPHRLHDSILARISLSLICVRAEVKDCWRAVLRVVEDSRSTGSAQAAPPNAIARSTYVSAVLVSAWEHSYEKNYCESLEPYLGYIQQATRDYNPLPLPLPLSLPLPLPPHLCDLDTAVTYTKSTIWF